MLAAPDFIIACPHCHALSRIFEMAEANMLGAITWTDGWQDLPLMPRPPRVTRCHACHRAFWTAEAAPVGYYDPQRPTSDAPSEWSGAPLVQPLDEAGLSGALREGLAYTPELELELRVAIWWRGNDRFRISDPEKIDSAESGNISAEREENMERVISLCANGEEDLLLFRAEAQRELGQFEEAKRTLDGVCCSDYWPAKSRLLELIAAEDRQLRVMFA